MRVPVGPAQEVRVKKHQFPWYHRWTRGVGLSMAWMGQHDTMASAWADAETPMPWRFGCMDLMSEDRGLFRLPPIEHPALLIALAADLAEAAQEFLPAGEDRPAAALAAARAAGPGDPRPWSPEITAAIAARIELRESAQFAAEAAEVTLLLASGGGPTPKSWRTVERAYFAALTAFSLAGRRAEGEARLLGIVLRHLPDPPALQR